jgi:tetratricopeptide (TPR) repeat protein
MDPNTLGLFANSQLMIQEGNQLVTAQYTPEDVDWAKKVNVYALKAEKASRAGKRQEAIALYKDALRLAPGCDLFLMSIGCCYANMGEVARGLQYLERAHEISPGQERITRNLVGVRQAAVAARTGLNGRSW